MPEQIMQNKQSKRPRVKVSMRLNPEIVKKTTQLAEADHRSFSQYVERLLAQHLETHERLAENFPPGQTLPVYTPYGETAAAERLMQLWQTAQRKEQPA